jgi:hypothetical protein
MIIGASFEQGGDYEAAIDWLETAYERHDPDAPYIGALIKDPAIRAHPRFNALLTQMGLGYWAADP